MLCNNAGVDGYRGETLREAANVDWAWTMGVNFWGVIHGTRAFLPRMLASGEPGHVVNRVSAAALAEPSSMYRITKHAVLALTGPADGPPQLAPGGPASWIRAAVAVAGLDAVLPDPAALLGELAACAGLSRDTVAGSYRSVPTADGWLALSLAREPDIALVPALIGARVESDPWSAVATWAGGMCSDEAENRLRLLGLPGGSIGRPGTPPARPGVRVHPGGPRVDRGRGRPVVVDLSSLWARPLCGNLLALAGARVVKVESRSRPDGARSGPRRFYDLLHAGQGVGGTGPRHRGGPASAARAGRVGGRRRRGVPAARAGEPGYLGRRAVAMGTIWVSITAYGRESGDRVGFGDDVAAAAGLVVDDGDGPYPVGDAIADPLAGVTAAAAAGTALHGRRGCLLEVSMRDVAAQAASLPSDDATVVTDEVGWVIDGTDGRIRVSAPRARPVTTRAAALGADTDRVLAEVEGDRRRAR